MELREKMNLSNPVIQGLEVFNDPGYSLIKWPITAEKIAEYRRLAPQETDVYDCAINTLHFLGVISDRQRAEELSAKINVEKKGVNGLMMLEYIYHKYSGKGGNVFRDNGVCFFPSALNSPLLVDDLGPGFSTIINIYYFDKLGHTIVVFVDFLNQAGIFDPQNNFVMPLEDYFREQVFDYFCLVFRKITKKRFRKSQELKLRKSSEVSRVRKKLRVGTKTVKKVRTRRRRVKRFTRKPRHVVEPIFNFGI